MSAPVCGAPDSAAAGCSGPFMHGSRCSSAGLIDSPQDAYERERLDNVHPSGWRNPQPADRYNLVVVGAGTAGLVAAHAAAALGAKVALIERDLLGGDCLNVGCVPSKAIIRTSRLYAEMRDAERYGAQVPADIRVDFPAVMQRMRRHSRPHQPRRFGAPAERGRRRRVLRRGALHRNRCADGGRRDAALQEGRDRDRRAAGHALDSRPRRGRLPDQRERLRPDRAAAPPAGDRRRPARLRAGAGVLPLRSADHHRAGPGRCSCPRRNATPRRSSPMRSRATASRCG